MFSQPGFRGIKVLPYPNHIKNLIKKVSPSPNGKKDKYGMKIYQGHEMLSPEKIESE
jgi:hypothetical protein